MRVLLVLAGLIAASGAAQAGSAAPQPPCGADAAPAYAAPGEPPRVGLWLESELAAERWTAPSCLPWRGPTRLVAAVAGRVAAPGGVADLLGRIGAFSRYESIRYWSSTHRDWRPLFGHAVRVDAASGGRDLQPDQFQPGRSIEYREAGPQGAAQRLTVLARTPDRVVLALQNVSEIRLGPLPLFAPGALQTTIFLDRESDDVWRQFQILRAGAGTSALALGSPESYANRLAAFFGYVAGHVASPSVPR
jgi:hypothetical protein